LATAALVAALFWFVVVATASAWLGGVLAFAVLALTVLAMVVQPGGARPGDETVR
jgi:hypothetical protein